VIFVLAATAPFEDFHRHRARHHVTARQILGVGRVALHKAFTVGIEQNPALAAHAFGNQYACAGDAGRMELPEFHILQRNTGAHRHAEAIASIDKGIGRSCKNPPRSARSKEHRFGVQDEDFAGFHFERRHADHITIGIADQIERHPFDKKLGLRAHIALIERVQHGVPGSVSRRASALHRRLAKFSHVAAEGALVDFAVFQPIERHAEVFQLDHDFRRLSTHELDRILVTEPVGALDRVVHMPFPLVFLDIAQRSGNAALRRNRVRARRENLGNHGGLESRLGKLQCSAQTGAARADDHGIKFTDRNSHCAPHTTLIM